MGNFSSGSLYILIIYLLVMCYTDLNTLDPNKPHCSQSLWIIFCHRPYQVNVIFAYVTFNIMGSYTILDERWFVDLGEKNCLSRRRSPIPMWWLMTGNYLVSRWFYVDVLNRKCLAAWKRASHSMSWMVCDWHDGMLNWNNIVPEILKKVLPNMYEVEFRQIFDPSQHFRIDPKGDKTKIF